MNRDTYARFLRSETYKELLLGGKKKVSIEFKYLKYIQIGKYNGSLNNYGIRNTFFLLFCWLLLLSFCF
jgi:hypothetical protein